MKITINCEDRETKVSEKDSNVGVGFVKMSMDVEGFPRGQEINMIPPILLEAACEAISVFLNRHECQDCRPFKMYSTILAHIKGIQRATMSEVGENMDVMLKKAAVLKKEEDEKIRRERGEINDHE